MRAGERARLPCRAWMSRPTRAQRGISRAPARWRPPSNSSRWSRRVLAPNPSGMTLDGTNTYVVGEPGSGQAVLVDPGPDDAAHLAAVEAVLAARDARCVAVLVTHHHGDHAEAALPWGARFGAQVPRPRTPPSPAPAAGVLEPGERLALAGTTIGVVPTPGHTHDHLAFRLESGAVLVGDHVLGRGTSVVTHPEGDVVAYLESLRRVHDLGPERAVLRARPRAHRGPRRGPRVLPGPPGLPGAPAAGGPRRRGAATVDELVATVYAEVPRALWPAAAQSTRATLAKLRAEGRVRAGRRRLGAPGVTDVPVGHRPPQRARPATGGGGAGRRRAASRATGCSSPPRPPRRCWPSCSARCAPASSRSSSTPGCRPPSARRWPRTPTPPSTSATTRHGC